MGALSIIGPSIADKDTASRLTQLGLVFKLTALVRQAPLGPPPPLPPRRGSPTSDAGGGSISRKGEKIEGEGSWMEWSGVLV